MWLLVYSLVLILILQTLSIFSYVATLDQKITNIYMYEQNISKESLYIDVNQNFNTILMRCHIGHENNK